MPKRITFAGELLRLARHARLSADELQALQWRMLRNSVSLARRVPFYRARFRELGIGPEDIRDWDDFRRLPVTTKEDIRAGGPAAFLVDGVLASQLRASSTTGSSGTPMVFYRDGTTAAMNQAAIRYCLAQVGSGVLDRFCHLLTVRQEPPPRWPRALGGGADVAYSLR
ncbi:hypothetical protein HQ576_17780, partial [bacterium]|nr:hypothetical protein [bacterium]